MKPVAIYVRASSNKQDHASQLPDLERYAADQEARGNAVRWYRDKFTGKTMNRPGFNSLVADIRRGLVGSVVVWRLDRLGRLARGLLTFIDDECQPRQVNLVSLMEGVDLSTPTGRLLRTILAGVAEFETELRGERVAAGLAAKRERVAAGLETWQPGRPRGTPDKLTPEVRRAVLTEVATGKPKASVARAFGLSRQSVYTVIAEATLVLAMTAGCQGKPQEALAPPAKPPEAPAKAINVKQPPPPAPQAPNKPAANEPGKLPPAETWYYAQQVFEGFRGNRAEFEGLDGKVVEIRGLLGEVKREKGKMALYFWTNRSVIDPCLVCFFDHPAYLVGTGQGEDITVAGRVKVEDERITLEQCFIRLRGGLLVK